MTLTDRIGQAWDEALRAFAPRVAAKNEAARLAMGGMAELKAMVQGYDSVQKVGGMRSTGVPRSANADTLNRLGHLRSQSRHLGRNHPIAAGAINTNVDRIVGTGLALQAMPNRTVLGWSIDQMLEWKANTQREFSLWADSNECDVTGAGNFYDAQGLVLRSTLESGDCFTLLPDGDTTSTQPYKLRLQMLEADRVGNPNNSVDTASMAAGVRLNQFGRADAFHVYAAHPGTHVVNGNPWAGTWIDTVGRSGRRRILQHFRRLRPEQARGVPYLAPIIELLHKLGRYSEAEVTAAVVSAMFTVFITTESGSPLPPIYGGQMPAASDAGAAQPELGLGNGAIVGLAPNEKVEIANPNRPNTAFEGFVKAVVKQIGVALGLPAELLMKEFNTSYSASKAALLDAWVYFRSMRTWLTRSFCQPVYETWLAEAVATGRVPAPGFFRDPLVRWAYTRANWFGDSMGSINPKDEVSAYTAAIDARLMTRERAEWELFGTPWDETLEQKAFEEATLIAKNLRPVAKAGAPTPAAPSVAPDQPGT
jgi:lambda family phage portal protein